jgi:hypothetical protein
LVKKNEKVFNIDEWVAEAEKVKTINIPGVGPIKYKVFTYGDLQGIPKDLDDVERGIYVLYVMLHKADEKVTLESVKKLPYGTFEKLLEIAK